VRQRLAHACRAQGRPTDEVELLAVSKKQPAEKIRAAFSAGQRLFGENRVQEIVAKAEELADLVPLRWHFVGSLQTNKVKDLLKVARLELVHSLDRIRLADELQRELVGAGRRLGVLLQVHATDEPAKHGCAPGEMASLLEHVRANCAQLDVRGLMAMGPREGDSIPAFQMTASLRDRLAAQSGLPLSVLSLGMSRDLEAGVAAGATVVRVGAAVFGLRTSDGAQ